MHIRKLKILIAFILLICFAPAPISEAASDFESDEDIAAGVIGTAGRSATYDISLGTIFSSEEDFGQDLYEMIYNRVKSEGSDLAVTRTLERRPLSKEELFIMIPGSNIGGLLTQTDPKVKMDAGQVEARRLEVQKMLAEEKVLADLEVLSKMEVEQTEFFSNGDESDSGFDLLVDLDVIDLILFGKTETEMGGAGPGAPAGSNIVNIGGKTGKTGEEEKNKLSEAKPGAGKVSKAAGAGVSGKTASDAANKAQETISCPLNQDFNDAVLEERAEEESEAQSDGSGDSGTGTGAGGSGGATGTAPGGGIGPMPLIPEPAKDWSRPLPCNDFFCLTIEAIYKRDSSYLPVDNCIACHFEKINDLFKQTLGHTLSPSKATGNLIEAPKCKRGLFTPSFNLVTVSQPIITPPNDDLVVKGDFIKNLISYLEKYYGNPGRCKDWMAGSFGCKPDPDPTAEAGRNTLNQAGPGTTPEQLLKQTRKQVAAKKQEAVKLMEQTRTQNEGESQAEQFSVLAQEIDTMNSYFESYIKAFNAIIDPKNPESPFRILTDKADCS